MELNMQPPEQSCKEPYCFFCAMNEENSSLRRAKLIKFFQEMPLRDDQEHILTLSSLWNIAMSQPNNPEFPSLGVFGSMAKLIQKGVSDKKWLLTKQNIYIPYYAAHVIGSYTMNKAQFAQKAVKSEVVSPLMELLRGKITWVEQRVAVRALGHIASHDRTFEAIAVHEGEIVELAMKIASTCLKQVYQKLIRVKESSRLKYHCNLLTRGLGGLEIENEKAEEWATQLQCWSLYLLNCFACREREKSLSLICKKEFLKELCRMWGGLASPASPAGIGLIKTLCQSKKGRQSLAEIEEVIETICNISRSSDDWKIMAIDSLLLLLKDPETRYKVIDIIVPFLGDLVELGSNVGERITQILLLDYHKIKYGKLGLKRKETERALEEIWDLKVERKRREKLMSEEEVSERKLVVGKLKKQGNQHFWSGEIQKAVENYSNALSFCPLKMGKDRVVLYSNRAQCYLLMRKPENAISDSTRALSLSSAASPHGKSLWRRSHAYDMKGLARESLMDSLLFVKGKVKSQKTRRVRIPYYAARMINKQMNATWIFADARREESDGRDEVEHMEIKLPRCNAVEEPLVEIERGRRRRKKLQRAGFSTKGISVAARISHVKTEEA